MLIIFFPCAIKERKEEVVGVKVLVSRDGFFGVAVVVGLVHDSLKIFFAIFF
jgi:hypothetical protein